MEMEDGGYYGLLYFLYISVLFEVFQWACISSGMMSWGRSDIN